MNITYRSIYFNSDEDCGLLSRWNNDPEIKHLFNRFPDSECAADPFTPAHFRKIGRNPPLKGSSKYFMIEVDAIPIGQATLEFNTQKLLCKTGHTAWIAISIGDKSLHRSGIGKHTVMHLERLAAEEGALRIEVGIFEYNETAKQFFTSLGYDEFMHMPNRTWWDGRFWSEIRFLKFL
jgi:diamine N-acetyltransferase